MVRKKLADGTVKEYRYDTYKKRELPKDTVAAIISAYQTSPKWRGLAAKTRAEYGRYLRELEASAGSMCATDFRRRDAIGLRDWISERSGNGAANVAVTAFGALFSWAVDSEWIEHSPMARVGKLPGGHIRAWSAEQASVALSKLPEHLRRAVTFALYTGQRRGDLCAMLWSAYSSSELRFRQQKTGEELVLPVHPELKREMDTWERTAVTILTNPQGRPWLENTLSKMLKREMGRIGFPPGLSLHGLRKLFAATIADGGGTTHQIAAGTGHRTLGMVALYTRSADQRRLGAEAVRLLPKFGKDGK